MTRRHFVQAAGAAAVSLPAQTTRRNIVFILTDDHRYDMIGALGHPWLKGHTPNMDRLVQGGVTFRNAFVTSSLCSPSRASILTGVYMHTHGVTDNFTNLPRKYRTFPEVLQQSGYRTAFFGKWHMGGSMDGPQPGFDYWLSFRGQGEYQDPEINRNGKRLRERGNMTDILTAEAQRFINDNAGQPFCVYLSHKAVHAPFQPPERHAKLFEGLAPPKPRTMWWKDEWYRQWPEWVRHRRVTRHGVDGMIDSDEPFETHYRRYCQSLVGIDDSVGQVLKTLEEKKLLDDTLVVYMGDNGYMWGEHGLIDKRAMYESSIRVPLVAHCPALFGRTARNVDAMALNLDIAPTFLEAAGAKIPEGVQGRSLLPVASGKTPRDWRRDFLYEYAWEQDFPYTPTIVGLRTDRYSLMHYPGVWDIPELYDNAADPDQIRNLLAETRIGPRMRGRYFHHLKNPETRKIVQDLQARMAKLLADTGSDPRLASQPGADDKFAF